MKIVVFGLVGETPNYWRSEYLSRDFVLEKYPKYERILFRAAARGVVEDRSFSASLPMPTFGATSRRENGKLLEKLILDFGILRRTTCPVGYGNAWRSPLLSLYGRAIADVEE